MDKTAISLFCPMGNNSELGWALLIQHGQDHIDFDRSSFNSKFHTNGPNKARKVRISSYAFLLGPCDT